MALVVRQDLARQEGELVEELPVARREGARGQLVADAQRAAGVATEGHGRRRERAAGVATEGHGRRREPADVVARRHEPPADQVGVRAGRGDARVRELGSGRADRDPCLVHAEHRPRVLGQPLKDHSRIAEPLGRGHAVPGRLSEPARPGALQPVGALRDHYQRTQHGVREHAQGEPAGQ